MRIRDWRIAFFFLLLCGLTECSWGVTTVNGPLVPISDPVKASPIQRDFQDVYQRLVSSSYTIPSGMIAMFATSCPGGWTRFTALDNAFPYGGSSYGATGGSNSITLSVAQLPAHNHTINDPGHTHQLVEDNSAGANGAHINANIGDAGSTNGNFTTTSNTTGITINNTGSGASIDIHPAYVTVVWCQKT